MKPLVDKKYRLEKFQGKGGWTYARIPGITPDKEMPFGLVKVKGTIDGYAIEKCHLMPTGKGQLFLPVKAAIRKKINFSIPFPVRAEILCRLDLFRQKRSHQDRPAGQGH